MSAFIENSILGNNRDPCQTLPKTLLCRQQNSRLAHKYCFAEDLGKGSKTPVTENVRYEKSVENLKIGRKTVFLGKKTPFSAKIFQAAFRDGGVPPFSVMKKSVEN